MLNLKFVFNYKIYIINIFGINTENCVPVSYITFLSPTEHIMMLMSFINTPTPHKLFCFILPNPGNQRQSYYSTKRYLYMRVYSAAVCGALQQLYACV